MTPQIAGLIAWAVVWIIAYIYFLFHSNPYHWREYLGLMVPATVVWVMVSCVLMFISLLLGPIAP